MCGRYTLGTPNAIKERFETENEVTDLDPSWNIAPGMRSPVIIRNSPNSIVVMKWGLIPFWAKDPKIGYKMINARSEDIENKPTFRRPIRGSRCLVPTDGFYEWKRLVLEGKEEKFPWYFGFPGNKLFAFAGIYDIWKDAEGYETYSYSIITTNANKLVGGVHDRMPVILKKENEGDWLNKDTPLEKVLTFLTPYMGDDLVAYPVSDRVNKADNDGKELIHPINTK